MLHDLSFPVRSAAERHHYATFYGDDAAPDGAGVVIGNCQAESLRIVLDAPDLPLVRIPPVHELTADDVPRLDRLLAGAGVVVSQPVRDDYHALPLGSAQVRARLAPDAAFVLVPAVRHTALHPAQAVFRFSEGETPDPPIAPYHDLRTVAEVLTGRRPELTSQSVRDAAARSARELRTREQRHGTVVAHDLFAHPSFDQLRTVNHPGNPVFLALAERVRAAIGRPGPVADPGRPLLTSIRAPREAVVAETWGIDPAEVDDHWTVGERRVHRDEVDTAHRDWYAAHPDLLDAVARRHAEALAAVIAA